MDTILNEHDN